MAIIKMMTYKGAELTFLNRDKQVRLSCYGIPGQTLFVWGGIGRMLARGERKGKTREKRSSPTNRETVTS